MGKRALLAKWLQDIRASYWFLPSVLALSAIVLAQVTQYLDHNVEILPDAWQKTQVAGARSTLALIAQSMIGVAGVMFSMTIVAVSFASGNFGPRLIGNFMRDRGNQWSLGILISTFVYALLILRAVQSPYGPEGVNDAFVPHISMLVALGLTGLSVMSMIFYVHHIPEIINVSNISAKLGARLKRALETRIDQQQNDEDIANIVFPDSDPTEQLHLRNQGYVQTWDKQQLTTLANDNGLCLEVRHSAGEFVSIHTPILNIWSESEVSSELFNDLRDCFAVGPTPTEQQNLLFIVQQLVEMIARALSPGVNDPFTAINCLNWLYVGLSTAANYEAGLKQRLQGRVRHSSLSFEGLFDAAIGASLPYVLSDKMTRMHLDDMLARLTAETSSSAAHDVIQKTQDRIADFAKSTD